MEIKSGVKCGSSDGFWYDLTRGGYINPAEVLVDTKDIADVESAIRVLEDFESSLEKADALEEF